MNFLGSVIAIDFMTIIEFILGLIVVLYILIYVGYLSLYFWYLNKFKTKCPKCKCSTVIYKEYIDNFKKYSIEANCINKSCDYIKKVK